MTDIFVSLMYLAVHLLTDTEASFWRFMLALLAAMYRPEYKCNVPT